MTRAFAVLAVALACVAGARGAAVFVNQHNGETFYFNEPHYTVNPNDTTASFDTQIECICSDADPRPNADLTVTYNCFHQALYGNCDAPFMALSTEELTETDGYCMMSCGRCDCCTSPYEVIKKTGNTKYLKALSTITTDNVVDYINMDGLTGTMLVPSDAAWEAAEAKYGDILADSDALLQIFKYNFLPPEPRTRGLWTTPFMALGAKLYTDSDAVRTIQAAKHDIPAGTTARGGITGIKLTDVVGNTATITVADLRACRTYVNVVDEVLLPFDPTSTANSTSSFDLSAALDVGNCEIIPNAIINGTTLVPGPGNRVATPGECCDACSSTTGCNLWYYCPIGSGCRFPNGNILPFGSCQLQRSPQLAAGQPLAYGDSGWAAVPVVSGYIA